MSKSKQESEGVIDRGDGVTRRDFIHDVPLTAAALAMPGVAAAADGSMDDTHGVVDTAEASFTTYIPNPNPPTQELIYNGEVLPKYDAVIPRIGASITFYGLAVLRQCEMMGMYPLNESVAIGRARDKLRSIV